MKKEILGFKKEKTGEISLIKELTDKKNCNGSIYYKVLNENANIHIGTAFKKNRALVSGGGAKPWKQKHTGRARAGTRRSPIWVGGGVTFGNQRKNYKFRLPKNIKRVSMLSLFNIKFNQDLVTIIDNIKLNTPRIKEFSTLVKNLINLKKSSIFVVNEIDDNLKKASRNINTIKIVSIKRLVLKDFLNKSRIFMTKDAVEYLNNLKFKITKRKDLKDKEIKEKKEGN